MKILIVKLSAIGDVTHTLPALVALREHYPDARIDWLVEDAAAQVIEGHDALDRIIIWRRRYFLELWRGGRWMAALAVLRLLIRELRDTRYDLVIDFQALLKSGVWVLLSRAKRKAGFGRGLEHAEGSYLFLNERVPAVSMEVHALERGLKLLAGLGVVAEKVEYRLPVDAAAASRASRYLSEHGWVEEKPLVLIHPQARWKTKLWFSERFAVVADRLAERGMQVVFTGGPADSQAINEIVARTQSKPIRADGQGDLKFLVALLRIADVMVSTDTGPMHLAAATGTPVVALFGPTAANRTGPYGGCHHVISFDVPCRPCFKRFCQTTVAESLACMKGISADQVLAAVCRVVSSPALVERSAK